MIEALDIQVSGIVQGVGFRPFIYRLARKYLINGWVLNATDGVFIHAEGEAKHLDEFVIEISENPPPASRVESIEMKEVPIEGFESFDIRFSDAAEVEKTTLISPDLATCKDCERELFDPGDRRYRYPFINCTNCGPRFTIIDALPYDRKNTSMRKFPMCFRCRHEYDDPLDRRFHAQPDACFECGPHISWRLAHSDEESAVWGIDRETSDALFAQAVKALKAGSILAVKGLGGFHLVCDAENEQALSTLRARKRRKGQAFAVMMRDVEQVRRFCEVDEIEESLLTGSQRPIVLLRKRKDAQFARGLADGLAELGVMLPYTPIQHILLHDFEGMLVMTSANIHDEPIVIDDDEAYRVLGEVADAFLGHDRAIAARYDDSVVRVIDAGASGRPIQFIRRARGYAPMPLALPAGLVPANQDPEEECVGASAACDITCDTNREAVLGHGGEAAAGHQGEAAAGHQGGVAAGYTSTSVFATGPEQKNTFCLTREDEAFVSQHIGDMENAETFDAWLEAKQRYERLFEITPTAVACDLHPEYLTSKWGHDQPLPVIEVQHHHAHIAAVMAENGLEAPVAGIAFDGTGYGIDKTIWGGEVLLCNLEAFERFANFVYVPMPGGAAAIKHPLRMAYGVLWAYDLLDHPMARKLVENLGEVAGICGQMIEQGLNTPMTSSVGRLFDAASAILGVCTEPRYEGEGAILLEAAITSGVADAPEGEAPSAAVPGEIPSTSIPGGGSESTENHSSSIEPIGKPAKGQSKAGSVPERTYTIDIVKNTATADSTAKDTSVVLLDAAPAFEALLDDMQAGVPVDLIARRFHDAFVQAIVDICRLVDMTYGINAIALSGGVFMNRYLLERVLNVLPEEGFMVAINRELPPNDGCISFGQAVVAWATNKENA